MSNSADDAVFDYFSLLLSEPEREEPEQEELQKESASSDEHEDKRGKVTANQDGLATRQAPAMQRQTQNQTQVQAQQALSRPVITQAAPPLNKLALEQLLAPVTEIETETEAVTETETKQELKTLEQVKSAIVEAKPAQVETATQAKPLSQVKEKIEEKLETSASIKQEEAVAEKVELAASVQTQTGATPPGVTEQLIEQLDEEFQVLFFKVAGLTLAVPLVSLGGIVKVERINHIMGRPDWYLGVQTHRDSQLNVVDSGAWVMPEKYDEKLAQSVDYQYIVLLENSNWGLACESLVNSVKILKSEVNWRSKAGKRPWLAGVVKEQMCGILHVQALIELLNLGLGSQDSIG
ncbi:chemotaxis protein CheW [Shewanella sp. Isolate8]|uniref:chemotaxis protein CheW n=1 Tax=Shewanella sp. Isolate8 TaxID=2908529 RepID=UPI001EFE92B1|nr:chemotaxis protein CheW [Shewanella sp. Isolate8]MCG9745884.1 chemotaxis protein CheW [Shewanella sp. Isolate8]